MKKASVSLPRCISTISLLLNYYKFIVESHIGSDTRTDGAIETCN